MRGLISIVFAFVAIASVPMCPKAARAQTCASPAGIVAWNPMDSSGPVDLVDSLTGSPAGGAFYAAGFVGSGLELDGDNDYWGGGTAVNNLTNFFTVELWFRYDSFTPAGEHSFIMLASNETADPVTFMDSSGFSIGIDLGTEEFFWEKGSTVGFAQFNRLAAPRPSMGVWHHLAVVFSPTNGIKAYLDGAVWATDTSPIALADIVYTPAGLSEPLDLGGFTWMGDVFNDLDGAIDEFTVYDIPLSAAAVQEIYAAGAGGKCRATAGGVPVVVVGDAVAVSSTTNGDGSTTVDLTDVDGKTYAVTLPAGAAPLAGSPSMEITLNSGSKPAVKIDAVLAPGTTKTVSIPKGSGGKVCIKDKTGAQIGGASCAGGNLADLPTAGSCAFRTVDGDPADGPHTVTVCLSASSTTITVGGLLHTVIEATTDVDADGTIDEDDHCPATVLAAPDPQTRPNHLDDSGTILGCNRMQVLMCKPGQNNGERAYGLTPGSQSIFFSKVTSPIGWANQCLQMYPNP